jgi:uncharacterized protein YxeA
MKILSIVAVLLAIALGAMFLVDTNIDNDIPFDERISQYIQLKPDNFRTKELLQKYPELNSEAD